MFLNLGDSLRIHVGVPVPLDILVAHSTSYMPAQGGTNFFPDATNPIINGGTFSSVTNQTHAKVNGLQLLLKNVAEGALHNSAERGDPPRCHERTRIAIREEIMQWIEAPSSMRKLILWMYGPAGSGKTAIAQSIAEECERLRLLAATFFFWRSAPGRNNTSQFVATIAYQLSRYIPQFEDNLIAAIDQNPIIFSSSLSTQMRVLIIEPLKLAAPSLSTPMVAIVDGVDECGPNGKSQSELLHVLGSIASELSHLPLVFLVSSRPEYELRKAFNGSHLSPLTKVLVLDNTYQPDEDIKIYLDSEFRKIYDEDLRELVCRLPSPWPTPSDVDFLVSKASGQFIVASTVIKFVGSDSPRSNPADRLDIILRQLRLRSTAKETPFAPLDLLYRFILESVRELDKVLQVLMLLLFDNDHCTDLDDAEKLLSFDIRRALIDMHALLSIPPPTNNDLPEFHHASLSDFLMDRSRSAPEYYIDETQAHVHLCRRWLTLIGPCSPPRKKYLNPINFFLNHSRNLHSPGDGDQELVEELARFDLRAVLERISDFNEDLCRKPWSSFLKCVKNLGGSRENVFPRLQNEFNAFILDRIDQYPPTLKPYVPILLVTQDIYRYDILTILLHNISKSVKELNELRELDRRLLHLFDYVDHMFEAFDDGIWGLLEVAFKAGQYVIGDGGYAALAKTMINIIWPRPGEKNHRVISGKSNGLPEDSAEPTAELVLSCWEDLSWLIDLLKRTCIDLDLACLLRERVLKCGSDEKPVYYWGIIEASCIEYIKRCKVTVSNSDDDAWDSWFESSSHSEHNADDERTSMGESAVVEENIPGISTEPPPLPLSISELSDADIESTLALADQFDVATYPFTHILQFSPYENGTVMVWFAGDDAPFGYLTY